MMTYEQFLKQLRRIGRQLIISSIVLPLGYLAIRYTTRVPLRVGEMYMLLAIFTFLFSSGIIIYPGVSES